MLQVSRRGHISSHLNLESLLTPAPTQMGSSQTNPPHPPIQHHKFIELKANNFYVFEGKQYFALKYKFALMITMVCT